MREAGDVCFADVDKTGCGVVEYQYKEDVKYAVRQLDNTKFKSHKVKFLKLLLLLLLLLLIEYFKIFSTFCSVS